MRFYLLLIASIFFFSCGWPDSSTSYVFEEKVGEVMLTDLNGITYMLVCSVNGDEKKCGVVFDRFNDKSSETQFSMEYSTTTVVTPGFKDASFLSIKMKDENTGKSKSLVSYMQGDVPYTKGSTYVPSVMALNAAEPSSEYTYKGYFEGDKWIKKDTTIVIGDTLFANDKGVIDFTVFDTKGNKAHVVMDLSKLMESNDKNTIDSAGVAGSGLEPKKFDYYWRADSGSIVVEPLETNFEFVSPTIAYECSGYDPHYFPFVHIRFMTLGDMCQFDSYLVNGGVNTRTPWVSVNYAK